MNNLQKIIVQPCKVDSNRVEYHIFEATHNGKLYFIRRKTRKGMNHYTSRSYAKLMTANSWESGFNKFIKTL